jgi:thiamine-phosphate pyrophosphorylase
LYAITDDDPGSDTGFLARCAAVIAGGAVALQFRDKTSTLSRRRARAQRLNELCRVHHIPLIINDDIELADHIGAAGVHLGRDDASLAQARDRLGANAIVGVSCYNDLVRARAAAAQGASYIAFGRFFTSQTKPEAALATPGILIQAREQLSIPIVAIGGITRENGLELIHAGAGLLAVIKGVFGKSNPAEAARAIAKLFAGV